MGTCEQKSQGGSALHDLILPPWKESWSEQAEKEAGRR